MPIAPETNIYLLKGVPLDNTYRNTINFDNAESQANYFIGLRKYKALSYSYQRKEKETVRVNIYADYLYDCNYLMYQNAAIGGKWFYCFITGIQYLNDEVTEITFENDVIQTWMFDYHINPSFIEREHTNDDTIGGNLIPENLETGEYICTGHDVYTNLNGQTLVVASTIDLTKPVTSESKFTGGGSYSGIYSGAAFFAVNSPSTLNAKIAECSAAGQLDAILAVFYAPSIMVGFPTSISEVTNAPWVSTWTTSARPTALNGYTPRNKKLLTFPYCYTRISNNNGSTNILHFEKFSNPNSPKFSLNGSMSTNCEISLIPQDYNGTTQEIDQRVRLTGFPQCSWNADLFQNWEAVNRVSIGTGLVGSALSVLSNPTPMGLVGSLSSVAESLSSFYGKSLEPPTTKGNLNSANINATMMCNTYENYVMTIRAQFARVIDEYFDMYGYKTHRVKVPNIKGRENWNYIKTINVSITGSIPANDLAKLRNIHDDGITYWHNGANVGNYSLSNNIV